MKKRSSVVGLVIVLWVLVQLIRSSAEPHASAPPRVSKNESERPFASDTRDVQHRALPMSAAPTAQMLGTREEEVAASAGIGGSFVAVPLAGESGGSDLFAEDGLTLHELELHLPLDFDPENEVEGEPDHISFAPGSSGSVK